MKLKLYSGVVWGAEVGPKDFGLRALLAACVTSTPRVLMHV